MTEEGDREVENFVQESTQTLAQSITAESSGEHKIKISHAGSLGHFGGLNAGPFHLALLPVHDPGPDRLSLGAGDQLNDYETVVLNTYGDTDRIRVFVQPGKAYSVRVLGREEGLNPPLTAATPRIARARPPSWQYTDYHMGKPWVEGVTTTAASTLCHKLAEPEKCEFQAFVIDLRGISGAQQTWQIEVAPTQRPGTRPYRIGGYAVEVLELSSSQLQGVRMPLRAWFASQPVQHDGTKRIKVQVTFSEAPENVGADGVQVEGGTVTSVSPVEGMATDGSKASKGTRSAGGQGDDAEDREVVWEFEIEPDSDEDVTVSLEAWSPCDEPGAICTADGRTLSTAISTTVRGPDEVAAPEPPDQPRSLEATATPDRVVLTWDDPQDDSITGYVILRRNRDTDAKGHFDELAADTGSTAATYTDASVAAETRYTYRIKAINEHGTSERSRWVHIDTPTAPEPETPPEPDNNPATGAPIISGTAQVGETLTADRSEIADEDGTENATFSYQWLADDAEIAGATSLTYALSAADEGKAIKVEVTFTDDAGNAETLTSAATDAVDARPNNPATGAPTISGTAQVGETLSADKSGIADADGLKNATFSYQWLADDADINGATGSVYTLADSEEGKAIKVEVSFTDDEGNAESLTSAATDAVAAAPTTNTPATGAPTITGTAQVGETLTANTSGIADADGLSNVQYEYQWLADDADISGATGSTYTLADAEEGKAIKVEVTFTDDADNEETLTSAATDVVAGAQPTEPPAKPKGLEATSTHDSVTLTWDDPQDESITGYVILRRVRENDQGGDFSVLVANTGSAATTYTDNEVAASTTYTYRIKAINGAGVSERSRWVHIDTPAAP